MRRITTQTANPQVSFGDYTAMAVGADFTIHPCWTDCRGNPGTTDPNQDVVTQSISLL